MGAPEPIRDELVAAIGGLSKERQPVARSIEEVSFADLLRAFRIRKGASQQEVSDQLQVKQSTVSRWEKGEIQVSAERLQHFLYFVRATPEELHAVCRIAAHQPFDSPSERSSLWERFYSMTRAPVELMEVSCLLIEHDAALVAGSMPSALAPLIAAKGHRAAWYQAMGRYKEAVALSQATLKICQRYRAWEEAGPAISGYFKGHAMLAKRPPWKHLVKKWREVLPAYLPVYQKSKVPSMAASSLFDCALFHAGVGLKEEAENLTKQGIESVPAFRTAEDPAWKPDFTTGIANLGLVRLINHGADAAIDTLLDSNQGLNDPLDHIRYAQVALRTYSASGDPPSGHLMQAVQRHMLAWGHVAQMDWISWPEADRMFRQLDLPKWHRG